MGFDVGTGIPVITVFVQGLLSFFSPCVLPLVPLYLGYLAGGSARVREDGTIDYPRKTVLVNTVFFVVGVSFAFFLLGFGFTALGQFFTGNQRVFSVVAGLIMVAFGLYMLGAFGRVRVVETERRLPFRLDRFAMNPLVALALGFTFSFAWTPCVGPVLAGVLLMASSSASAAMGYALVGVYTLGFVLPFLAVGLFTGAVLRFFRTHGNVVKYTVKVGGALLVVMGVMTITGWMNGVTSYLSSFGGADTAIEQQQDADVADGAGMGANAADGTGSSGVADGEDDGSGAGGAGAAGGTEGEDAVDGNADGGAAAGEGGESKGAGLVSAPRADMVLTDQYGAEHALSDYRGKVVFLNFFATWCGPCKREMPDIEALYHERGKNQGDVVVLGVANPRTQERPQNSDVSVGEVKAFIEDEGITYPVLMDTEGALFSAYGISAFPTTFMIDKDGNVFGYVTGMLTADTMESIVNQTMNGVRAG